MTCRLTTVLSLLFLIAGCSPADNAPTEPDPAVDLVATADALARNSIILDSHIDVPNRLDQEWEDVTVATDGGNFDYPRAVAGGLNAAFMSIYTPAELEADGGSREKAELLIDLVQAIVASAPDKFAIALSADDVEEQFASGLISLPMGMENGSPIAGDLGNIQHFYDRGIRYITLTHSLSNHIADSSYDENHQWDGLSEFGAEVVKEMNRLGIMVDISHVSDAAFYDVIEITSAPVIASHSSARFFTPGFERNMSDEMITVLANNGGVIMVNYGSSFISGAAQKYSKDRSDAYKAYLADNALEGTDELNDEFNETYDHSHGGFPYADIEDVLDHFEHIVQLVGIRHVGIGSDFDGVGDSLPVGLKDVSSYPALVHGLLVRGFTADDVRKILGGNLLRVWREIEAASGNANHED
jgi:membrane dipeptidase